jgi:Zn-finger nucleic acid-binding protein
MQCPLCRDTELEPRFSRGIEVDVCPRCRGLWLDRGELERLLDEGGAPQAPAPAPMPPPPQRRDDRGYDDRGDDDRDRRYDDDDDDDRDRRGGKRKKSKAKKLADLFEEVLDF